MRKAHFFNFVLVDVFAQRLHLNNIHSSESFRCLKNQEICLKQDLLKSDLGSKITIHIRTFKPIILTILGKQNMLKTRSS